MIGGIVRKVASVVGVAAGALLAVACVVTASFASPLALAASVRPEPAASPSSAQDAAALDEQAAAAPDSGPEPATAPSAAAPSTPPAAPRAAPSPQSAAPSPATPRSTASEAPASKPSTSPAAPPAAPAAPPASAPAPAPAFTPTAQSITGSVLAATNEYRRAAGLPALAAAGCGEGVAARQSVAQASSHTMSHQSMSNLFAACGGSTVGENVAMGYRSVASAVVGWYDSPGHRANMLNPAFRSMAAAVAYAQDGTPYYTQVFFG